MVLLALFVKSTPLKGMKMCNKMALSVYDLGQRWGVIPQWVYSNYKKIGLHGTKIGGHLRFLLSDVEEWEARNRR
jgi:hypothetical protein